MAYNSDKKGNLSEENIYVRRLKIVCITHISYTCADQEKGSPVPHRKLKLTKVYVAKFSTRFYLDPFLVLGKHNQPTLL